MRPKSSRQPSEVTYAQRGQILIIFAGGLVTILLFVALVIDGGFAFLNRREAQNIADTSSLAGTKVVLDRYVKPAPLPDSSAVWQAIDKNVTAHGCTLTSPTPCTWTANYVAVDETVIAPVTNSNTPIPSSPGEGGIAQGVIVAIDRQPRTFFLGVVGQTSWQVSADATSVTANVDRAGPGQLIPIATTDPETFEYGVEYELTQIDTHGPGPTYGPGEFGWLAWYDTNDPNALSDSICQPDNPEFLLPEDFPGDPGASNAAAVRACLDYWIATGTPVLIPIVSGCEPCNGEHAVFTIVDVAVMVLTGYDSSGPAINSISGRFLEYYNLPTVPGGLGGPPTPNARSHFIGLIR